MSASLRFELERARPAAFGGEEVATMSVDESRGSCDERSQCDEQRGCVSV